MDKKGKKAALYIRVSTDAQREEGYSIEAQKEALIGYCKAKGIKNHETYIDGGWSGSNLDRPEMQRLIRDAKNRILSHCIVYKLDRLSRSQKDTLYLIEDVLNPHDVDFVSINETIDTGSPMGRLMIGILSAFAQLERENIKERTRMGMLERVKSGYWMGGGRIPFGYDYDAEKGTLIPNADAETVKKCYSLYLNGYSTQMIADMLGLKYNNVVFNILTKRTYLGIIPFRNKEYKGIHTPLIDEETYNRVQERISMRSSAKITSSVNLLTGLIVCGRCGAKMYYQSWGKGKAKIMCYSQQKNKMYLVKDRNCDNARIWKEDLEDIVIKDLFRFAMEIQNQEITGDSKAESVLSGLKQELSETETKIRRLYALYAAAEDDLLLKNIQELQAQRQKLEKQIQNEQNQDEKISQYHRIQDLVKNLSDVWPVMTVQEQKNIVHVLVEKITIDGEKVDIQYRI